MSWMDNFEVYDIRLSAAQIEQAACGDLQGLAPSLRLAYGFEEGSGTTTNDISVF